MAATQDVLLVLRWISDGRDAFGDAAENGAYLAVINRGAAEVHYRADCPLRAVAPSRARLSR